VLYQLSYLPTRRVRIADARGGVYFQAVKLLEIREITAVGGTVK